MNLRTLMFSRIAEAGHFLHQERPGQVNREIVDWLKLNDDRFATRREVLANVKTFPILFTIDARK